MTDRILDMLLSGETVSGEAMAKALGVTRAAVFKQIAQLREQYKLRLRVERYIDEK